MLSNERYFGDRQIMLTLSTLIGKGLHRECFIHPSDPSKCVKVVVHGNNQETKREQNYYHFLASKRIAMTMLPFFYGNVATNMGVGAVFDLVRDSDGKISHSLEYYLTNNHPPPPSISSQP